MKTWFRKQETESSAPADTEGANYDVSLDEPDLVTPESFLSENEIDLSRSASTWRGIASSVDLTAKPDFLAKLSENAKLYRTPKYNTRVIDGHSEPIVVSEPTSADIHRLASETSVFLLLATRFYSRARNSQTWASAKVMSEMGGWANPFINKVFGETFDKHGLAKQTAGAIEAMRTADSAGRNVLLELCEVLSDRPGFARDLSAWGKNGGTGSEAFQELKRIITVDWRHPSDEQSVLRTFLQKVKGDEDFHLDGFIEQLTEDQKSRRHQQIQEMARFALVSQGMEKTDVEAIAGVLRKTYTQWHSFDQLSTAFDEYRKVVSADLEMALIELCVPQSDSHYKIRAHRTLAEMKEMAMAINDVFYSREIRKRGGSIKSAELPNVQDLMVEESSKALPETAPEKPLFMLKKGTNGSYELADLSVDKLIEEFKLEKLSPETQRDIELMVQSIREQPLGAGTKKILSGRGKLRISEGGLTLRRFSPLDRTVPGRSSKDSLGLRITYAITHNGVALFGVMTHEEFNNYFA